MTRGQDAGPPPSPRGSKLTVVLTAHDRRQFLGEALASLASQGLPADDLDVVLVANFEDPQVLRSLAGLGGRFLLCRETEQGAKIAKGLELASGEVVAFMDDDDLFEPGRLVEVQRAFAADPKLSFYRNGTRRFPTDEATAPTGKHSGPAEGAPRMRGPEATLAIAAGVRNPRLFDLAWKMGGGYNTSSMAVRHDLVRDLPISFRRARVSVPPFLFYLAWVRGGGLLLDPTVRTRVRVHSGSSSFVGLPPGPARLRQLLRMAPTLRSACDDLVELVRSTSPRTPLRPVLQLRASAVILSACERPAAGRGEVVRAIWALLRSPRASPSGMARDLLDLGARRVLSYSAAHRRLVEVLGPA